MKLCQPGYHVTRRIWLSPGSPELKVGQMAPVCRGLIKAASGSCCLGKPWCAPRGMCAPQLVHTQSVW
jgi:hypothetical protein